MAKNEKKGLIRAFVDFFVLFSGVSTASNLARTQGRPPNTRGIFLFRRPSRDQDALAVPDVPAIDDRPHK
ncbi:MAG: hypothetical protein WDM87_09645 [Terracidiphilus sp.]